MCYINCPYENYYGECTQPKMMGTEHSGCREEPTEPDEDNALEN